jgi:hypothetical protein
MNPDVLYETALEFLQQFGVIAVVVCAAALLVWLAFPHVKAFFEVLFYVQRENRGLAVKAYLRAPRALRKYAVKTREGDKTVKRRARLVGFSPNKLKSQVTMVIAWPTETYTTQLHEVEGKSPPGLRLGFPEGTGFSIAESKYSGRDYEHPFSLVAVLPVDMTPVTDWQAPS